MMNPYVLMELARERHRDLLDDVSPSRRRTRIDDEPSASDGHVLAGRAAHAINARAHLERSAIARTAEEFERRIAPR